MLGSTTIVHFNAELVNLFLGQLVSGIVENLAYDPFPPPAVISGRLSGLMVSALDSLQIKWSRFKPVQDHCVVFLDKTLHSRSASLHPEVNGYQQIVRAT